MNLGFLPRSTTSKSSPLHRRNYSIPAIRNRPPEFGIQTLSFFPLPRLSNEPIHPDHTSSSALCFEHDTRPQTSFCCNSSVTTARLRSSTFLSQYLCVFYPGSLWSGSKSVSTSSSSSPTSVLPPKESRHQEVRHDLQRLHWKQLGPLQHIQHDCLDFRSISESIEHRISVMDQLNLFPGKIRSSNTIPAFILSHCS